MKTDIQKLIDIWKNDFALRNQDKPRLFNLIKETSLDVIEHEIEPGIHMLFIRFYAPNLVQKDWIETHILLEMQETFASMAELDNMTLSVELQDK